MNLSGADKEQIEKKGLTVKEVEDQIGIFKRGNIKVDIREAATVGNGIFYYNEKERKDLVVYYESQKDKYELLKFVPASGAATRMFKALHNFLDEFNPETDKLREYLDTKKDKSLQVFFDDIEKLPFYEEAVEVTRNKYPKYPDFSSDKQNYVLVKMMLTPEGMNLSDAPKGLVPFHNYKDFTATAFEEHLYEAAKYCEVGGIAKLHFTVAESDKEKFEKEFKKIKSRVEDKTGISFEISYSYQDPKTDTIAVDDHNKPFRTQNDKLFFRPGGHGALIQNLDAQDADIVFVKNIDNVVTQKNLRQVIRYKKMLAGKLLKLQEKCFQYMNALEGEPSEKLLDEIAQFQQNELFIKLGEDYSSKSTEEKIAYFKKKINRPLRVGGMVKNEGEPGGGPFLVKGESGEVSLQIIEGAQIDDSNPEQVKIVENSTHFNPVDLVCGLKDYKGKLFNLQNFVDSKMSFIADKTKDGKPLKALERPGLWNGGMAQWNTVFVEIPVETFNPVKTVADLLKKTHQA